MKDMPTLHITITKEEKKRFDNLTMRLGSKSHAETLRHAIRALEEKEAARDRELAAK